MSLHRSGDCSQLLTQTHAAAVLVPAEVLIKVPLLLTSAIRCSSALTVTAHSSRCSATGSILPRSMQKSHPLMRETQPLTLSQSRCFLHCFGCIASKFASAEQQIQTDTSHRALMASTLTPLVALQPVTTMQPGSKGGYYTEKSPKMLLLEWCQQQKRQKPRYKVMAAGAKALRCKVRPT